MNTRLLAVLLGVLIAGTFAVDLSAQIPPNKDDVKPAPKPQQKPAKLGTRVDLDPKLEAELPEKLKEHIRVLRTGHILKVKEAATALVREGDPRLLPLYKGLLDDKDNDGMRQAVTMGIIEKFPDQALEIFLDLIENGSLTQQQSSTFALAWVADDPRVRPTMVKQLTSPDATVRGAASYAVLAQARQVPKTVTDNVLNDHPVPLDPSHVERLVAMRQTLVDLVVAGKPIYPETERLIVTYGDHVTAGKLQDHYIKAGQAPKKVKEILAKAFRVNRYWLGRAVPPDASSVSYTFNAQNLGEPGKEPKYVNVSFDPFELETMRARRVHLDRVLHLELLSDVLFSLPQGRETSVYAETESDVTLRFTVPKRSAVRVGIGSFNWGYFQAPILNAGQARVRFDRERGVLLSEEILSKKGRRLVYLEYGGYEPFRDGGMVPTKITADFPSANVGRTKMPIYFELSFQVVDGKFWGLADATSMDMTDPESPALLAVGSIEQVRIVDAAPEPKKETEKEAATEKDDGGKKD